MTTQYGYRVVRFDMKWNTMGSKLGTDFAAIERQMNVVGAEGWELVKVSEVLGSGGMSTVITVAIIALSKGPRGEAQSWLMRFGEQGPG